VYWDCGTTTAAAGAATVAAEAGDVWVSDAAMRARESAVAAIAAAPRRGSCEVIMDLPSCFVEAAKVRT
jgi:hypothetical protein